LWVWESVKESGICAMRLHVPNETTCWMLMLQRTAISATLRGVGEMRGTGGTRG